MNSDSEGEVSRHGGNPAILHYHLFKNAGTSVDALLKARFPGQWVTKEFPAQPGVNRRQVEAWIREAPQTVCFSSHTAMLPPPQIPRRTVFPIVFVRHPLDRIASAYTFEHKQEDSGFGSTLARNTTMRGYVETRLAVPNDRQCRNFHVERFAAMFPESEGNKLDRALRALRELPFVGVVEQMDESMSRLRGLLVDAGFSDVDMLTPVKRNVSQGRLESLDARLDGLRQELGADFYAEVERANAQDLTFYEAARALYESADSSA